MPFMGMRNHQLRPPRGLFMFPPQADKVSVIIHGVLVISRSVFQSVSQSVGQSVAFIPQSAFPIPQFFPISIKIYHSEIA